MDDQEDVNAGEQADREPDPVVPEAVECLAAKDPPFRLLLVTIMLLGFGVYSYWDAYYAVDDKGEKKYTVEKSAGDYYFNVVCGYLFPPLGIAAGAWGAHMLRRRFVADQEGLGFEGKDIVPWGDVVKLVKRDRGLLDVHYKTDGSKGKLTLDSWKLKNYDDLILLVESKTADVPLELAKKAIK